MLHQKAGREIFHRRNTSLIKADGFPAISAREMRVALVGFTVMGQFEMAYAAF